MTAARRIQTYLVRIFRRNLLSASWTTSGASTSASARRSSGGWSLIYRMPPGAWSAPGGGGHGTSRGLSRRSPRPRSVRTRACPPSPGPPGRPRRATRGRARGPSARRDRRPAHGSARRPQSVVRTGQRARPPGEPPPDAEQPRRDLRISSEPNGRSAGPDEGLLGEFLGVLPVADDPQEVGEHG